MRASVSIKRMKTRSWADAPTVEMLAKIKKHYWTCSRLNVSHVTMVGWMVWWDDDTCYLTQWALRRLKLLWAPGGVVLYRLAHLKCLGAVYGEAFKTFPIERFNVPIFGLTRWQSIRPPGCHQLRDSQVHTPVKNFYSHTRYIVVVNLSLGQSKFILI